MSIEPMTAERLEEIRQWAQVAPRGTKSGNYSVQAIMGLLAEMDRLRVELKEWRETALRLGEAQ